VNKRERERERENKREERIKKRERERENKRGRERENKRERDRERETSFIHLLVRASRKDEYGAKEREQLSFFFSKSNFHKFKKCV